MSVITNDPWREAVIDRLVTLNALGPRNENNPKRAVEDVVFWETLIALDPRVSSAAAALEDAGFRRRMQAFALGAGCGIASALLVNALVNAFF